MTPGLVLGAVFAACWSALFLAAPAMLAVRRIISRRDSAPMPPDRLERDLGANKDEF